MDTTAISGCGGSVTGISSTSEIKSWSMTLTQEVLEATSFDTSCWKQFVTGLKGATGTLTAVGADIPIAVTTSAVFKTKTGGLTFTAKIIMHSATTDVPVDGLVTHTGDFTVTGEVTET